MSSVYNFSYMLNICMRIYICDVGCTCVASEIPMSFMNPPLMGTLSHREDTLDLRDVLTVFFAF